ncbi:MAG TPA: hypothetical protein PLB45_04285 [Bacilli bacterium]|nr:hypothetical protein [Bacilli bacterium]
MKDATGELSMTAVAVVAIAAILVVFNTLIWPSIKSNITRSAKCSQAFSCDCSGGGSTCTCKYCEDDTCATPAEVQCPNQNNASA